jgi:5-methyltetrahydropteroyltriglutamate--homocysteine methyltransferase
MSAASPGVIAVFSPNRYYASQQEYLGALAEAMREEYEAIHRAGLVLQLDCPDLAMTAPGAGSLENFRRQMELNMEALNHALPTSRPRPCGSRSAGATGSGRAPPMWS